MISNYNTGNPYGHSNAKLIELEDIEKYTLEDYGLTIDAVKSNHFGIAVQDPRTGEHLPDAFYRAKIEEAVAQVEKDLDIVILPRLITEHHDFYRNDFQSFTYIHTHRKPILQIEDVRLEMGGNTIFKYPARWWRINKLSGHIQMMPSVLLSGEQGNLSLANAYSGYPMIAGIPHVMSSNQYAPQLFHVTYVGGMLPPKRRGVSEPHEMHPDLWSLIIKKALKEVFQQWGRLIIGAGIADMSISIDGIEQSIGTTQSAMYSGASAEIEQLDRDIAELEAGLKSYYGANLGII